MTLQSMTGFARQEGQDGSTSWVWEIRSVNGKGLDLRLRVPSGYEALEAPAREILGKYFSRGNMQINLQVSEDANDFLPKVNEQAVTSLIEAAKELQAMVGGELPGPAELMAMRGVVELIENQPDPDVITKRNAAILNGLEETAKSLQKTREQEGNSLSRILSEQISGIEAKCELIESNDARSPEAIRKQLTQQVEMLLENSGNFDTQRLHQEAALLAAKADLQEELDRLKVHLGSAAELLSGKGPVGRKLDFLAQEFNRECNTICSKSNSAEVTSLGLDMKLIIDQFREQLQNME